MLRPIAVNLLKVWVEHTPETKKDRKKTDEKMPYEKWISTDCCYCSRKSARIMDLSLTELVRTLCVTVCSKLRASQVCRIQRISKGYFWPKSSHQKGSYFSALKKLSLESGPRKSSWKALSRRNSWLTGRLFTKHTKHLRLVIIY